MPEAIFGCAKDPQKAGAFYKNRRDETVCMTMKTAFATRIPILIACIAGIAGGTLPAFAENDRFNMRIGLAYAAEDEGSVDNRFDQFELHGTYDDAHELNDAWLGMPVRDATGRKIGYVEDAFLDDEGYLEELLVSIDGSGVSVYVDQKHVDYSEVAVLVDMPVQAMAKLERELKSSIE